MNIFLTGASGLVGGAFARAAARRGHVVTGTVGQFPEAIEGLARQLTLDLSDEAALTTQVLELFPEVIVNCAAISEPAQCEADPARAQTLNVVLPSALAQLAHHVSARLIHLSSEQVFAGDRAPYGITAPPAPLNLYGRQKLESERVVLRGAPEFAAVVRAPLLGGNSPGGRRSLHERLFADWAAGRVPRLYTDEIRQVCSAENLAEVLVELCERPALLGVFHWAGAEGLSRYELGQRIRAHFKFTEAQAPLVAVSRADDPAVAAKRQADLRLDLAPLAGTLKTQPETFAQQLEQLVIPPPCRAWYLALT
ncbi:MAG TPA: sugar nucleotide-binding protein [Opitutaceae bacterium]